MQTQTVSDVVVEIKNLIEDEFINLSVVGEVSNLSPSSAGHYYFTLSDEKSALSCALFKMDALRNPIVRKIKNGDKIIVSGPISVYQKRGSFQLIAKRILPHGKGDFKAEFEKLKKTFADKGYFDLELKKEIPRLAKKIVVITALKGAALQDFLNIIKRRSLWFDLTIIPAVMQGDQCAPSVVKAIDKAQQLSAVDVIVITRGGGSTEDLWGFNHPQLVEKIFACDIPIISAVGHQVDYTLSDFVSDMRCETPSAAAEILSQYHTVLEGRLSHVTKSLKMNILEFKSTVERKLYRLNPVHSLTLVRQQIVNFKLKLNSLKLDSHHDPVAVNEFFQRIDELNVRMTNSIARNIVDQKNQLNLFENALKNMNPENVLGRGYALISTEKGDIISSKMIFDGLSKSESISLKFNDGIGIVQKKEDHK